MRKDAHNPSPAIREIQQRFATAGKGARGVGFYKGRRLPNSAIEKARAIDGIPATAPHYSYKEDRRRQLRAMFERSGIVLVTWYGKIVSFFTPTQIRYYEQQAVEREQRERERALEIVE